MDPERIFPDEYVPREQAASTHKKWEQANPNGDAPKWRTYRDAVLAYEKGDPPVSEPAMATPHGDALVAVGKLHMSVIDLGAVWEDPPPPDPPPPPPTGGPTGYHWKGDFSADAQDFSAFDMHDTRTNVFTDWAVGTTRDVTVVNKPVGSRYPWSNYSCRVICNNQNPSNSASGQTVNLWQPSNYGFPWVRGQSVWCRVFILIPDGTNPTYPGKLTPVPGDGVASSWHVLAEWHKNDGAGAPGPTSTKFEVGYGSQGFASLMFHVFGSGQSSTYLFETNQVQTTANGVGGSTGPIGGTAIPIQFNHWYDCLWRWYLQPDSSGEIDWYVDGNLRATLRRSNMFIKTDGTTPGISFQAGMYRNYPTWGGNTTNTTNANEHVYVGPMIVGPTRASVGA